LHGDKTIHLADVQMHVKMKLIEQNETDQYAADSW